MTVYLRKKENYFKAVKLEDIKYLEADSNYTRIVTVSDEIVQCKTLKDFEKWMRQHDKENIFWRISRFVIINKLRVDKIVGNSLYIGDRDFLVALHQREFIREHFVMI